LKTAQNYLLEVEEFFEECHKWYQDTPSVGEISLIGQAEEASAALPQANQKIISYLKY
jgi:hypothetical protein